MPKLVAQHSQRGDKTTTTAATTHLSTDDGLVVPCQHTVALASSTGAVASMSWDHRRTQLFVSFERGFRRHHEPIDGQLHTPEGATDIAIMRNGRARHVVGFTRVLDWRSLLSSGIVVELPVWVNPGVSPLHDKVKENLRSRSDQNAVTADNATVTKRVATVAKKAATVAKKAATVAKDGAMKYSMLVLDRTWPWFRFTLDAIFLVLVPAVQVRG